MSCGGVATIGELDLGPELAATAGRLGDVALEERASAAVVAGCLVAFAPGVSEQHRTDVLQSLLLAQLAANAKAERHRNPSGWFEAYRAVLEQAAWVVAASSGASRYRSQASRFSVATVVADVLRRNVAPDELALVAATVRAPGADPSRAPQLVFECPSHSGGIGNFQVALATEEDGAVSLRLAQVSFTAPQHVLRLLEEEFTAEAQFRVAFLDLTQNEEVYATLRSTIARKVESRFPTSVVPLELE